MKPEDVPDAWADVVYSVLHQKLNGGPNMMPPDVLEYAARHAIASIAPLIAAAEREACAREADSHNAHVIAADIRARGTNE